MLHQPLSTRHILPHVQVLSPANHHLQWHLIFVLPSAIIRKIMRGGHDTAQLSWTLPSLTTTSGWCQQKNEFSATCQTKKRCCLMNGSNRETWIAIIHYEDLSKRHFLFKNFTCIRINPFQDDCLILRGKHHDHISIYIYISYSLQNKLTHVPLPSITAITMTAMPMTISSAQEAPDTLVSDISPKALQTGGQAAAWNFWCLVGGEIRLSIAADRTILCQFVSRTTMGCHQHVILANRSNRQFSTKWCSRKTKGWPDMYN